MSKDDKSSPNEIFKALSFVSQIGITIFICVALGILLGWLLDRWLGTSPLFLLILIFLGIAAAIKSIIDFAKKL